MPPKSYKKTPWVTCEKCHCNITSNDISSHLESDCLSESNEWISSFIKNGSLYTSLELVDDNIIPGDGIYKPRSEDIVYVSSSAATLCNFVIGEPVILQKIENNAAPIVRRLWPTKSSNPAAVLITSKNLHDSWCTKSRRVKISPITSDIVEATNIVLLSDKVSATLQNQIVGVLQRHFAGNIINQHNRLVFYYFGRRLDLIIYSLRSNEKISLCSEPRFHWFRLSNTTVWNFQSKEHVGVGKQPQKNIAVGGLDKIITEIKELIDVALTDNLTISRITNIRGVLLYGLSGTGKTTICKYLTSITDCQCLSIDGSEIFSKYYGETENTIKKIFQNAITNAPTILLIDQIDTICPKKVSAATDQERRVVSTFMSLLDSLHESNSRVFVLATTNKIDTIEPSLRRFGRLDREIEIPVPDKISRREILSTLLSDVSHSLSYDNINSISDVAHGFVGADLMNLCTQASMRCLSINPTSSPKLETSDFTWALSMVKPSAMREVLIEVPNVKWTDIGGQDDLKLKLKQAVEWPLKHPESFVKLGIKPPNGVLMYGPPGCSKTMIAKALANESGLNFLSIKGPELFSKWVGESERAVRDLFRKARQVSPSIIFFDEIDALGGERSQGSGSANVHERVLAQILTELDGVVPLNNVTIVAATNRPDKIDKALLRPGRIDRMVYVSLPDSNTRKEIFRIKMSKMRVARDIDINELCSRTEGFSGAEVIAVCHEAALKALEDNIECSEVQYVHFNLALKGISPRTPNSLLDLYNSFSKNNRT